MAENYLNKTQFEAELNKCLHCPAKPCQKSCPVHCSPYDFIALAKDKKIDEAAENIRRQNPLGHSCGIVCPDCFCMKACLRSKIDAPLNIPAIQAYILHNAATKKMTLPKLRGKKIAVIGAGPAGLAAAWQLVNLGYEVVLFDANKTAGGALNLIPPFRLPKDVIKQDFEYIFQSGRIKFETENKIDHPEILLSQGYAGIIFAGGCQNSVQLGIEGENFAVDYTDYLKNPDAYATRGKVGIVGGGNVAVDCALTAKHYGAIDIVLFIRRKIFNMKVTAKEMKSLLDAEIDLMTTTRLCKINKEEDFLTAYTCSTKQTMQGYRDIDNSSVKREGFSLIIKAIGGYTEKNYSNPLIIYAGDANTGASSVVQATASGIDAAQHLHYKLQGETK